MTKKMTLQKPDKNKKPRECPYCSSPNGEWADFGDWKTNPNVMYCMDCDSTWFEYEDKWESVFQKGRIIKENEN